MTQQTAIEWLEDNLIGNPYNERDFIHNRNMFQQAKQMEKEQIVNAFDCDGSPQPGEKWISNGEQYYNETYNK